MKMEQTKNHDTSKSTESQITEDTCQNTHDNDTQLTIDANQSIRKRTVEEILRDVDECIGPLNFDDFDQKLKRPRWDQPDEIIQIINEERKKKHETFNSNISKKHCQIINDKGVITTSVPMYNFVPARRPDNWKRFYIKMKKENNKIAMNRYPATGGLLSVSYSQLKAEANKILEKKAKANLIQIASDEDSKIQIIENELWVDKYRPRKYRELLSDENVNFILLRWLKFWDKIVFNKDLPKPKKFKHNLFNFKYEDEVDDKGCLKHKIVLLSGPPGLGKTTLAHVAARHAGYNVVEINASDDRSPAAFREALLSSTQMRSVMGSDKRPNCLIMDEVDGAPGTSIDLLLKFVEGKLQVKGKGRKVYEGCHRPVICICNEVNTPSLRPLKAAALLIPVPPIDPSILTNRLMSIAHEEGVQVEKHAVQQLVERSGCDIRTCLGALQYMGGVDLDKNISLGMKDTKIGIFNAWKNIFQLPLRNTNPLSITERVKQILKTVHQGETDKLVQGVFHNYTDICKGNMEIISESLDWLEFYDSITTLVNSQQVWSVMPYTNYPFVVWHLNFASPKIPKLNYPTIVYENTQKLAKTNAILSSMQKYSGIDKKTLTLDLVPLIIDILNPRIRSTPSNMFRSKEKEELIRLINIMLDYGLTYIQEKIPDGGYDYKLDPNINEVGTFPECKNRRTLTYAAKQVLIQELEAERLKRDSISFSANKVNPVNNSNIHSSTNTTQSNEEEQRRVPFKVPSINKDSDFKPVQKKCYSFFDRFIVQSKSKKGNVDNKNSNNSMLNQNLTKKTSVRFKFKEGYTKVRRKVFMENIL